MYRTGRGAAIVWRQPSPAITSATLQRRSLWEPVNRRRQDARALRTTADVSVGITGVSVSVGLGALTAALSAALTGNNSAVSVGTIGVSAGGNVSVALTGVALAASAGTVIPALALSVAGNQATAVQGALGMARGVTLSGNLLLTSTGSVTATGGTAAVRKAGLRRVRYTPGQPPGDLNALRQFLQDELERINDAMESPATHMLLERLSQEPERKGSGAYIAYADGTNWNPGAGEGIYAYYANAWHKLG